MNEPRVVVSHRATTSSRTAGKVNEGTVTFFATRPVLCADCELITTDLVVPGEHGAHWVANRRGDRVLVNCVGIPITRGAKP